MARASRQILKKNTFVPPEGEKSPIDILPDELLAYLFETGVKMEISEYGDEIEYPEDASDEEEDEEEDGDTERMQDELLVEVVDIDGKDDADWSDVDEDGSQRSMRKRKSKMEDNSDDSVKDEEDDEEEPDREIPFQVLISHVCKRWRSVALNTPVLWSRLSFAKGIPLDKHQTYIERARNAPLEITIVCTTEAESEDGDGDEGEDEEVDPVSSARDQELLDCLRNSIDHLNPSFPGLLNDPNWRTIPGRNGHGNSSTEHGNYTISELSETLDLIIPHVQQWRVLSVGVPEYRWMYLLLARLHQCPPAETLEVLELYVHDDIEEIWSYPPELITRFTPFHGQAPYLRHCALWSVHLDWEASLGLLENLEFLDLGYHVDEVRPSYQTFEAILKSTRLQTLLLALSGPKGTEDDWKHAGCKPIRLLSVEELLLRFHPQQYVCSLLRFIDTPSLRSLSLDFESEDCTQLVQDLCKAPFGRSKTLLAGLENLKLSGLPCDRTVMKKMLNELSGLKQLTLNCLGEGEKIFEEIFKATTGLISSSSEGSKMLYCPALETIATTGITGEQMREFVEVRMKAGVPVQKVMMSRNDVVDSTSVKWLKKNVKEFHLFDTSEYEDYGGNDDDDDDDDDELASSFYATRRQFTTIIPGGRKRITIKGKSG